MYNRFYDGSSGVNEMTMIERVARAILNSIYKGCDINSKESLIAARAAIQAMRDPTEEMLDAGAYDLDMTLKDQYQNMIDKVLEE